jgi:hypothetical protein
MPHSAKFMSVIFTKLQLATLADSKLKAKSKLIFVVSIDICVYNL